MLSHGEKQSLTFAWHAINFRLEIVKKDMEDTVAHMNDEEAYRWLSAHEPDGLQPASPEEQEAFRKFLSQPFQDWTVSSTKSAFLSTGRFPSIHSIR